MDSNAHTFWVKCRRPISWGGTSSYDQSASNRQSMRSEDDFDNTFGKVEDIICRIPFY